MTSSESAGFVRLINEPALRGQLAQIAAKTTMRELGVPDEVDWTFDKSNVTKNLAGATLAISALMTQQQSSVEASSSNLRFLAQSWERMAAVDAGVTADGALLNAAAFYDMAGYQANSVCLARAIERAGARRDGSPLLDIAAVFLQRQYMRLRELARDSSDEPSLAAMAEMSDMALTQRTATAMFAVGVESASSFFLGGRESDYDTAIERLELAATAFGIAGDAIGHNTARTFGQLLPRMRERSVWEVLARINDTPRWNRYLRVSARGLSDDLLQAHSISELWPSQTEAVEAGILDAGRSWALRMPTSAGKTRIAEMAMVNALTERPGGRSVYVAPYRALVAEIESSFGNLFGDLGFAASSIPGGYEMDDFGESVASTDEVLVLTPEKLDLLQRLQPEILAQVRLVVVDEGHVVGDRSRGIKLELLLSRLRRELPESRFLFMSAVVPDSTLEQFAMWLGGSSEATITTDWRPSAQRHSRLEWAQTTGRGTLRYSSVDIEEGGLEFVPNLVRQREFEFISPETGRPRRRSFPRTKGEVAAELGFLYANQGPVLVYSSKPQWAESVATKLMERIELAEMVGEEVPDAFAIRDTRSQVVAAEWLGSESTIAKMLGRGIAFHHGQLPVAIREAIEIDMRNRELSVLVATNTLGQGVNLPFRTVVFHSVARYDPTTDRSPPLPGRDYWNIAGRAGRAGLETEGTIVHICFTARDRAAFRRYEVARTSVEGVESALMVLLRDLTRGRISQEQAAEQLDSDLLALLVEEGIDAEEVVNETLGASLFQIQALDLGLDPEPVFEAARRSANDVVELVPDAALRAVYASTGLSSRSCAALADSVRTQPDEIVRLLSVGTLFDLLEMTNLSLDAVIPIREMQPSAPDIENSRVALEHWLAGDDVGSIAERLGIAPMRLTRFVEDMFSYRLPWGISGFLRIASHILEVPVTSELARNLAGMVKYGVPSAQAVWAMSAGVAPRSAAVHLTNLYGRLERESSPFAFRAWLGTLTVESLGDDLELRGSALETTAKAVLRSSRNEYLQPLDQNDDFLPMEVVVRGTRLSVDRGTLIGLVPGERLELKRNFDNPLFRNSTALVAASELVGYLPWAAAQAIGPDIDTGSQISASVVAVRSGSLVVVLDRTQ